MPDGDTKQNQPPPQEGRQTETPGGIPEGLTASPDIQPVTTEILTAYSQEKKSEADKKKQRAEKDISVLENITVG